MWLSPDQIIGNAHFSFFPPNHVHGFDVAAETNLQKCHFPEEAQ